MSFLTVVATLICQELTALPFVQHIKCKKMCVVWWVVVKNDKRIGWWGKRGGEVVKIFLVQHQITI